ncbi:MAG TPA: signal peptidase II [Tepidisphaeraceae bacterium]|nr:signal peptidase II [Tepidisphaeraceae bacterium]
MAAYVPGSWTDNFRSPAALARFLLVMVIGLALDLWTKVLAETHLRDADPIRFIPGWLHFTYTENRGAVFGIGQGQRSLFLVVSVLAICFLAYLFATSGRQRFYQFVLGMLLGGVLGNLYDRYHFGYVRDMIHALPRWPNAFPWIFNVADSLLCVGVFLMIVYSLFFAPKPPGAHRSSADETSASANHR